MKKGELVQAVSNEVKATTPGLNITKDTVEKIISVTCSVLAADIVNGGETRLPRLGLLYTAEVAERKVRNPQTKEMMVIPAHRSLRLSACSEMKEALR
ncbi:MAG: HU family DNA-binding protein [Victivallales bacterium]|nr:HU family DNA-binding protein [Victivallales bacterium]